MPGRLAGQSERVNKNLLPPRVLARILSGANKRGSVEEATDPLDELSTTESGHAKTLLASATAVSNVVHSLYKLGKQDRVGSNVAKASALSPQSNAVHSARAGESVSVRGAPKVCAPKGDASESDDGSGADEADAASGSAADDEQETSSEDAYDFKAAAEKVTMLLGGLHTQARTEILEDMAEWHDSKQAWLAEESRGLAEVEADHAIRHEATRTGLSELQRAIETKQVREARAFMGCHATLKAGEENQLRKCLPVRRRFSSGSRGESSSADDGESTPVQKRRHAHFHASITDSVSPVSPLGARLRLGSQPFAQTRSTSRARAPASDLTEHEHAKRKLKSLVETHARATSIISQANPDDMTALELFYALAKVQEGQSELEVGAVLAHHQKATLVAALEHLTEGIEETTPAVLELISEFAQQVSLESDLPKGPSPEELEEEDEELQEVLRKQRADMTALEKKRLRGNMFQKELEEAKRLGPDDDGPVTFNAPTAGSGSDREGSTSANGSRAGSQHNSDAEDVIPPGTTRNLQRQLEALTAAALEQQAKVTEYVDVKFRMRLEQALVQYCTAKAEAGVKSLVEGYHPYDLLERRDPSEDQGDDATGGVARAESLRPNLQEAIEVSAERSNADQPGKPCTTELDTTTAIQPRLTVAFNVEVDPLASINTDGSPVSQLSSQPSFARSASRVRSCSRFLTEAEVMVEEAARQAATSVRTVSSAELSQEAMKKHLRELEQAMSKQVLQLELEKGRQNKLSETIAKLRQQVGAFVTKNKEVPKHLPGIERVTAGLKSEELQMLKKDKHLQEELRREQGLMEAAQSGEVPLSELMRSSRATSSDPSANSDPSARHADSLPDLPPSRVFLAALPPLLPSSMSGPQGDEASAPRYSPTSVNFGHTDAGQENSLSIATPPPAFSAASVTPIGEGEKRSSVGNLSDVRQKQAEEENARRLSVQAREDMGELLEMQSRNMHTKADIAAVTSKMLCLRKAMRGGKASGLTTEGLMLIVGMSKEESSLQPPAEHAQVRKDVRAKQREVRDLRNKWWTDHRELEVFVERGRQQGYQLGQMSELLDPEHRQRKSLVPRISFAPVDSEQRLSFTAVEPDERTSVPEEWDGTGWLPPGQRAAEQEAMLKELQEPSSRKFWRASTESGALPAPCMSLSSLPAARGSFKPKRMSILAANGRPTLGGGTRAFVSDAGEDQSAAPLPPERPQARRATVVAFADPRSRFNAVRRTIVANDENRRAKTFADFLVDDDEPAPVVENDAESASVASTSESSRASSEATAP